MEHDPLMLIWLFGVLQSPQSIAGPTALERDCTCHPSNAMAGPGHVARARRDFACFLDDQFRLGQIANHLE